MYVVCGNVALTTTKIIIFGAVVDSTCERERQREQKGILLRFCCLKFVFKNCILCRTSNFVCSLHIFSNFYSLICFICHRNEINLVDKFKSFLFQFILFPFFVHLHMDFDTIRCLSQPLGGRDRERRFSKYFTKGFTRIDDSIAFVKLNSLWTSIAFSFNLFNHSIYGLIWFLYHIPCFSYWAYRKDSNLIRKCNFFFFCFGSIEDANSKLCMKSDKMWFLKKKKKKKFRRLSSPKVE